MHFPKKRLGRVLEHFLTSHRYLHTVDFGGLLLLRALSKKMSLSSLCNYFFWNLMCFPKYASEIPGKWWKMSDFHKNYMKFQKNLHGYTDMCKKYEDV